MEYLNRIEIQGSVGSHDIRLNDDGIWTGYFDLHSEGLDGVPSIFDCRVEENGTTVKDLGAGIGGKFVRVEGRMIQYGDTYYVKVTKLDVVEGVRS